MSNYRGGDIMSLFFHYHDTHDVPIGDRVLTEENFTRKNWINKH